MKAGKKKVKVEQPTAEVAAENVTPEVKQKPQEVALEPWTADIRDSLDDDVTVADVEALVADLAADGKKLVQLYCSDTQKEVISGFDDFKDVELVAG